MDSTLKIERDILEAICPIKAEDQKITDLSRALIKGEKWSKVAEIIKKINSNPDTVRRSVLEYCSSVLLSGNNPRAAHVIRHFKGSFCDSGKAGLLLACYEVINT